MFDALKTLFSSDDDQPKDGTTFGADDLRLAEAALMFHVIAVDGEITDNEIAKMRLVLMEKYDLSVPQCEELFVAAEKADLEAVDLYRFTSLLKKKLDREQRIEIVEHLWEMVFADGEMHEFEDNVVWRAAQLLEVETQDRIAMKQRVRSRLEQH